MNLITPIFDRWVSKTSPMFERLAAHYYDRGRSLAYRACAFLLMVILGAAWVVICAVLLVLGGVETLIRSFNNRG